MKQKKEHIARPMDAYRKKHEVKCVDNPETLFRCSAAKNTTSYRTTKSIKQEFERISVLNTDGEKQIEEAENYDEERKR